MIINCKEISKIREKHKDERIVLVKGTFDLFHIGHLNLLQKAKSLGEILVVVLKCDEAVKLKGSNRPIINEKNRAMIVDSIEYVDYCIVANEKSVLDNNSTLSGRDKIQYERYSRIIKELKPNILIKQPNNDIPASLLKLYEECSTQIIELERTEGISTTKLIEKIRSEI